MIDKGAAFSAVLRAVIALERAQIITPEQGSRIYCDSFNEIDAMPDVDIGRIGRCYECSHRDQNRYCEVQEYKTSRHQFCQEFKRMDGDENA